MIDIKTIQYKRRQRFNFLVKLYEISDGKENYFVETDKINEEYKYDKDTLQNIINYLHGENLVEHKNFGSQITITHYGAIQIEEAILKPNEETKYFPSVNFIIINSMDNSQIIQDSRNTSQINARNKNSIESSNESA